MSLSNSSSRELMSASWRLQNGHQSAERTKNTAAPLSPPAYDLEIELRQASGRPLLPALLGWAGFAGGLFVLLWVVLFACSLAVPLPPGS